MPQSADSCITPKFGGSAPSQPAVSSVKRGRSVKEERMNSTLNTDRLNRLLAQVPPRPPDDFSPPEAPRAGIETAQPRVSMGRNSACRPGPSQEAVWLPIGGLHNKERVIYDNPLISANASPGGKTESPGMAQAHSPLFSPRASPVRR